VASALARHLGTLSRCLPKVSLGVLTSRLLGSILESVQVRLPCRSSPSIQTSLPSKAVSRPSVQVRLMFRTLLTDAVAPQLIQALAPTSHSKLPPERCCSDKPCLPCASWSQSCGQSVAAAVQLRPLMVARPEQNGEPADAGMSWLFDCRTAGFAHHARCTGRAGTEVQRQHLHAATAAWALPAWAACHAPRWAAA